MARRSHDDALGVAGAETIIGAGVTIHGELVSDADILIDGTLEGTIATQGNLVIGVNARIKASVKAANVVVAGRLTGNIESSSEVTIRETGQVEGDITTVTGLSIIPGGVFVGSNHMQVIADFEVPGEPGTDKPSKKKRLSL
jgi:cytoskeletal protein CcmA (bactofilin family)